MTGDGDGCNSDAIFLSLRKVTCNGLCAIVILHGLCGHYKAHKEHDAIKNSFGLYIRSYLVQKNLTGFKNLMGFTLGLQT
jgi:hypothetical protein